MRYTEEELKLIEQQNKNRVLAAQPASKLDLEIFQGNVMHLLKRMELLAELLEKELTKQKTKGK
jgi:hypothetical protein